MISLPLIKRFIKDLSYIYHRFIMDLYLSLKIPVSHRIPGLVDVERICVVFLQEFLHVEGI